MEDRGQPGNIDTPISHDPDTARVPDELGIDQSVIFRGLVRRAVLRNAGDGRFYLDTLSMNAMNDRRRRRAPCCVPGLPSPIVFNRDIP